jgi:hypothetical protein
VKQGEEEDSVVQTDNSGNGTLIRRASYPQGVEKEKEAAATSMATQFGRKLACELIFSHFGESVQKVCESLVYRGQLPLPEIARYTGMNITQLRNCLLVLIQHNCAQAFKVEHEGVGSAPQRVSTSYIALTDNILHRLRFPKFLVLVKEDVGDQVFS